MYFAPASTTVTLTQEDAEIKANFTLKNYTLTVTATNGSVTAPASSPVTVSHGAVITITAQASGSGYVFTGWTIVSGEGVTFGDQSAASTTITLTDGGAEIKAVFRKPVYVFYADRHNGDFATGYSSARVGADAWCSDARTSTFSGLPSTHVHALISVDSSDEIRDMPTNYGMPTDRPIVGPTGTIIASNWADLLDGTINATMRNATGVDDWYWTGSNANGSLYTMSPDHCSNWTSASAVSAEGKQGRENYTDETWLNAGSIFCNNTQYILGVAWDDE